MKVLLLIIAGCAAASAQSSGVTEAIRVYDAWASAAIKQRELPGASIAIVHDQQLVWAKSYGFADVERGTPATPSTLYRIASISKLFTATALMQLRDEGKLHLDDPVSRRLDWFRPVNRHPAGPPITIWALLTHTAGLPRESALPYWTTKQFPSREEMIRLLANQETVYPSETRVKYSNLGLAIAGAVVEKVSGMPYERYIQERILKPLGMNATLVRPEPTTPALAAGYLGKVPGTPREREEFTDTRALGPAANLASSVEDLARFVMLQFRDGAVGAGQILKGSTLREMHRVHWLNPDWRGGRGLGFQIRRVGEEVRVGHSGSLGGYRSRLEFVPASKVGVIALVNANDGDPDRFVDQAFGIVAPALLKQAGKPPPRRTPDPAWERYIGKYYWKNSENEVLVLDGELCVLSPDADNPWEARTRLEPAGEHAFRMIGGSAPGELLKFELDSSGRVVRYTAPGGYRLRRDAPTAPPPGRSTAPAR